jgi:hypothetical protein
VPDIRRFPAVEQLNLSDAFRRLRERAVGPLLEATLTDAGLLEARVYAEHHLVSDAVWPSELHDPDRRRIDTIILRSLGLSEQAANETRTRLYTELIAFTRKARLLELEAQVNRRGGGDQGPGATQLADDLWADLTASSQATVRRLPDDFLPPGRETKIVTIPAGHVAIEEGDLFKGDVHALRFGKDTVVEFESAEQRDLALILADNRVRGHVRLPRASADCLAVDAEIRTYLRDLLPKLQTGAAEITDDRDLQAKIISDALKRLAPHRR